MSSAKGKSYMRDSARASWRAILQLLCVLLAALAIPAAVCRLGKVEETEKFNRGEIIVPESMRQELRKAAPEWVLIGNSMLNSRIDATYLRTLSGRNSRKVTEGATQSAVWFLFMKQIVTASGVKPKWVTVFFRETDLTWPDIRTGGKKNDELIAALDGPAQPEWQQVMAWRAEAASHGISGVVRTTGEGLKQLLPGDWLLAQARRRPRTSAWTLPSAQVAGRDAGTTRIHSDHAADALAADIESYDGVQRAAAALVGDRRRPEIHLDVTADDGADLAALRTRITDHALPRLRSALDIESGRADLVLRLAEEKEHSRVG